MAALSQPLSWEREVATTDLLHHADGTLSIIWPRGAGWVMTGSDERAVYWHREVPRWAD